MPRVLAIDPFSPSPQVVKQAADALCAGRLVVLPTETVYGLCAHPDRPEAVRAVYDAKGRDDTKPLAFLAADVNQVRAGGATLHAAAERVACRFWPGALTLVLPVAGEAVGFRVPDHAVPQQVITQVGAPILATSANRSGDPPATTAAQAIAQLGDAVALVLDGGACSGRQASTVVSALQDELEILREGAISRADLEGAA